MAVCFEGILFSKTRSKASVKKQVKDSDPAFISIFLRCCHVYKKISRLA